MKSPRRTGRFRKREGVDLPRLKSLALQKRHTQQMEVLVATSLELNASLDLNQVLLNITAQAARLLGAHQGGLYLVLPDGKTLELVVVYNLPEEYLGTHLGFGEGLSGQVAVAGETRWVEDYSTWEGQSGIYQGANFHRVIAIPLKVREKVIGVINLTDDTVIGPYSPEEVRLAGLYADQAAAAMENARLFEAAQREAEERRRLVEMEREQRMMAEALDDTASALTSSLNLNEVLDTILASVVRVVPNDAATIMLVENGQVRIVRSRGYQERGLQAYVDGWNYRVDELHNLRKMAVTGLPLAIPDTYQDPNWVHFPEIEWLRSHAGTPIRARGRVLGFLNVDSTTPGFYHPVHAKRLQAFADHAAVALENARLFEEVQKRARQLALLNEITHSAISAPDLHSMLNTLANRLSELINADGAYITLWDPERQCAIPAAAYQPMADIYPQIPSQPGEHSMTFSVLNAGRVLVAEDVSDSPYIDPRIAAQYPERSLLGMPLIADGHKLGAALIGFVEPHQFSIEEVALAEQISGQIALAIAKMQLIETEGRQKAQLARKNTFITGLSHVAARIESIPDPAAVMETLGVELERLHIHSMIGQFDRSAAVMAIRYLSVHPAGLQDPETASGIHPIVLRISAEQVDSLAGLLGRKGFFLSKPSAMIGLLPGLDDRSLAVLIDKVGLSANTRIICLPLTTDDVFSGILAMWGEELQEGDLEALSIFAGQVAVTLENARLYADVQRLAITDEITGLYNRRGLYDLGSREIVRAVRTARPLCAVMMDIDHFKVVNDTYGHLAGDQVLRELGLRCRESIRAIDIGSRYGGEEFLFLLVETDRIAGMQVAERLRSHFDGVPVNTGSGPVHITVSLGVVEVTFDTPDLASVISRVDQALYQAKSLGRNRVASFDSTNLP